MGVIPRRRTAIKPRRAEFTVMGSETRSSPLYPLARPLPASRRNARVFFSPTLPAKSFEFYYVFYKIQKFYRQS